MTEAWPAVCTAAAIVALLFLIVYCKLQAFVALIVVSLGLGLAAGMTPEKVVNAIGKGVGEILTGVAVILALGAMLGRMLDVSGAAEVIARTLVDAFGVARASMAVLIAAYLIGIPVLFNVGFLLLIPIMWRLQRETGQSLLFYALPLAFSLGITHSLVPPHPGIVGCVYALGGKDASTVMIQTIIFGALMGVPMVLLGWLGPGAWWARRQMVTVPENLTVKSSGQSPPEATGGPTGSAPSFVVSVLIVILPLLLSLLGFGATLLKDIKRLPEWMAQPLAERGSLPVWAGVAAHTPLDWLKFLGNPTMALLIPTGLAFLLLGMLRGMSSSRLTKVAEESLTDVGGIVFLFAAAGGFKQVIQDSGAGDYIAQQAIQLPLSPVAIAYLVAVLMRMALGSATAAILTASALLAGLAKGLPGQETLLVLAVANGVTFMTQPADSGFWMVKEYCNLSVRDVFIKFNICRITMSLFGMALLLLYEACFVE